MITKDVLLTLTYLVGIGELVLAIFFWVTHSKNEIRKVMALLAFSTGMWVLLSAYSAYKGDDGAVRFANNLIFSFGIILLSALIHLVVIFPYPAYRFDKLHRILFYLPAIFFSVVAFTTKSLQMGATGSFSDPGKVIGGPLYNVYNIVLILMYLLALAILAVRMKKLDGTHLSNSKFLFGGLFIGGLPAVYSDLISPVFFPHQNINFLYGVLFTGCWLGATIYIVRKS